MASVQQTTSQSLKVLDVTHPAEQGIATKAEEDMMQQAAGERMVLENVRELKQTAITLDFAYSDRPKSRSRSQEYNIACDDSSVSVETMHTKKRQIGKETRQTTA
jgi:hypothetical protein